MNRSRIVIAVGLFCGVYAVIGGKLVLWGGMPGAQDFYQSAYDEVVAPRPDLLDRNGEVLATDIRTASLFAEPRRIVDPETTSAQLRAILPELEPRTLHNQLASNAGFVWVKRELTPRQQRELRDLGLSGIGFKTESKRFYPSGPTAAHVVGMTDGEGQGIAGMEKFIDARNTAALQTAAAGGSEPDPIRLSLDLRVQYILRDELSAAMRRYKAAAAGGVVLNAETGEVVALASMPDFDPNAPAIASGSGTTNRMAAASAEMGSTFSAFTTAMALESGKVTMADRFDASEPIRMGSAIVSDDHGQRRALSVPEVFLYSSAIGAAKEAEAVGIPYHQAFLTKLGLLTRMRTELPDVAMPVQPAAWTASNQAAIAAGRSVETTPLQTAVAAAALINGGKLVPPTFLPRSRAAADAMAVRVVSGKTSETMRALLRLNVVDARGSGASADVPGFRVGGKTATTHKAGEEGKEGAKTFNAFLAAFPAEDPRYVVLITVDEPKPEEGKAVATASMNAAPTAGAVIRRSAALLGVKPKFGDAGMSLLVSY
ncbi:peptidoglycan D,D-transpeptidase FtsI family protein [Mangrovicella endophytica]|uniref:peptidoglycan D,D-transpeptidase FtsI family protein n=1 Tax=Mangrovicella endophytica TaxID=2066697 RepID=UPI001FE0750D|nr:penicillin-binding protein 2 [Mangrovicella endophytica]